MIYIATVITVIAVMLGVRYAVKTWLHDKLGTIAANSVAGLAVLLEISGSLPWNTVLDQKEAAMVMFGVTLGNTVIAALKHKETT